MRTLRILLSGLTTICATSVVLADSLDIREWQVPWEQSRPRDPGVQPNVFVGFNPATESFFAATEFASGGGTIRHMHYHEPSGAVWFGTDTNYVGRVIVEPDK